MGRVPVHRVSRPFTGAGTRANQLPGPTGNRWSIRHDTGVEVIFRLYDMSSNGNLLCDETQTVDVVEGVYATDIGASNGVPGSLTAAIVGNSQVWLETEVDGQTLSPRETLRCTMVPNFTSSAILTGPEHRFSWGWDLPASRSVLYFDRRGRRDPDRRVRCGAGPDL